MPDIADNADNQVEQFTTAAMNAKRPEAPEFTGECFWCGDSVQFPRRWCCADCRDAYDNATKRAHGKY